MPDNANITPRLTYEESIANRMRSWKTTLDSISGIAKLMTGPLFAVGGGTFIAYLNASAAGTALAATFFPISMGLLAVGTISLLTALTTSYISSTVERASVEDRDERKAELSARYLVKELRANNMCLTVEEQARKDGKTWQQSTTPCDESRTHLR